MKPNHNQESKTCPSDSEVWRCERTFRSKKGKVNLSLLFPKKGRNRTVAVPALYHSARADFRFLVLSLKQIRVIDEVACQSKKV